MNKKSISQWVGVILSLCASPFIYVLAAGVSTTYVTGDGWRFLSIIALTLIGLCILAWIISKIIQFVMS